MESHKKLPNRIKDLLAYLNSMLSGKEEAIRLTLLSAIAGENIFLLGPSLHDKGTLVCCVARAFKGHHYGEGDSKPHYKEYDSYKLHDSDYKIAFINCDVSPVYIESNTFLAITSQKTQPFNLADKVLEEYTALHVQVNSASNDEAFFKFVENTDDYVSPTQEMFETLLISDEDIRNWRNEIDKVRLSNDAKKLISEIRRESFEYFVSDFRWRKIVHILRTCAFLNGRAEVDLIDCLLIDYAIPNHPVENILKQKAVNSELDRKQHPQYKMNIFTCQKYYELLKASVDDTKLKLEHKTGDLY